MMSRGNSKLRRSLLNALGIGALIAVPVLVSSNAFATPEHAAKADVEAAAEATERSGGAEHVKEAKAPVEKTASKKASSKASKVSKKKTASHKPAKKKVVTKIASKPVATGPDQGGILLSKPVSNEPSNHEGATRKASASHKEAGQHATMKASAPVKPSHAESTKEAKESKGKTASAKHAKKTSKKASARSKSTRRRGQKSDSGDKESSNRPCFGPAITLDRAGLEPESFPLLSCKGEPLAEARERISLLARPWGLMRPSLAAAEVMKPRGAKSSRERDHEVDPMEVAPGVRRIDEGLLKRLDAVARKFPGKVISVVSGYRPQSRGSLHKEARAIDLRVAGVANEDLAAFCKTLPDTGCGYYPNSSFVHVDVRLPGTGSVSWIDASGPGEAPRYVTRWPPAAADAPPPFSPPPQGDATEMGHDLGTSGAPSATVPASCDDPSSPKANEKGGKGGKGDQSDRTMNVPLFEDPPY